MHCVFCAVGFVLLVKPATELKWWEMQLQRCCSNTNSPRCFVCVFTSYWQGHFLTLLDTERGCFVARTLRPGAHRLGCLHCFIHSLVWFRTAPVSQQKIGLKAELCRCLLSLAAEERLPSPQGPSIQSDWLPPIDWMNRLSGDPDTLKFKSKQADVSL